MSFFSHYLTRSFNCEVIAKCEECGSKFLACIATSEVEANLLLQQVQEGKTEVFLKRYCGICDQDTSFRLPIIRTEKEQPGFLFDAYETATFSLIRATELIEYEIYYPPDKIDWWRHRDEAGKAHRKGRVMRNRRCFDDSLAAFKKAIKLYDAIDLKAQAARSRFEYARTLTKLKPFEKFNNKIEEVRCLLNKAEEDLWALEDQGRLLFEIRELREKLDNTHLLGIH
jgi:tetratricopeptide (TPR) repeat protein